MRRRRRLAALSVLGLLDFAVISLYQLGVIRSLPDPPGRLFDSNRVNASRHAFAMGLPDGPLGAAPCFYNMATEQERACPYCIGAGLISFAMIPDAFREARYAVRT